MIESAVHHAAGRFRKCRKCKAEPKHYKVHGRRSGEPVRFEPCPARHRIACGCTQTGELPTLELAETAWEQAQRRTKRPAAVAA
jgi:hypothetical protein